MEGCFEGLEGEDGAAESDGGGKEVFSGDGPGGPAKQQVAGDEASKHGDGCEMKPVSERTGPDLRESEPAEVCADFQQAAEDVEGYDDLNEGHAVGDEAALPDPEQQKVTSGCGEQRPTALVPYCIRISGSPDTGLM